jgi:hypothetical protein
MTLWIKPFNVVLSVVGAFFMVAALGLSLGNTITFLIGLLLFSMATNEPRIHLRRQ